jgi:hypothetical protein
MFEEMGFTSNIGSASSLLSGLRKVVVFTYGMGLLINILQGER